MYSKEKQADVALYTKQKDADVAVYSQEKQADATFYAKQKEADMAVYTQQKQADVLVYSKQKAADAAFYVKQQDADATLYAKQREAEAAFYSKQKEAAGLREMAQAYGCLADVLGGPSGLLQYLMLENNTYERLATVNAKAIQGLNPKITVWNTGSGNAIEGGGGGGVGLGVGGSGAGGLAGLDSTTAPIRNLFQSLPPLLTTIHDQTGVAPPAWLARLPQIEDAPSQQQQQQQQKK